MAVSTPYRHPIVPSPPCRSLLLFLLHSLVLDAHASPVPPTDHLTLYPRWTPIINNATGYPIVFNPTTLAPIPQAPASDGAGTNFSLPAVLWIVFCLLLGPPLALAGIRGWKLTASTAIGLAAAVCAWAAVINTVSSVSVSDLFLVAIVFGFFAFGSFIGLFEFGRLAGMGLLCVTGGLAFGMRIVIIKKNLLIPEKNLLFANWFVVASFGIVGCLFLIRSERVAITIGSASSGTFLTFLALDLILNKQAGMSRGLRYLFDRNTSHFLDIQNGYTPPRLTVIIIISSLVLVPVLAYFQHRLFRQPFSRHPLTDTQLDPVNADITEPKSIFPASTPEGISRFSL